MKFLAFFALVISIQTISSQSSCSNLNNSSLILETTYGKIKGKCDNYPIYYESKPYQETNPILSWLSVPYAKSPVKNLRFKDPESPEKWTNIRDGTKKSPKCYQRSYSSGDTSNYSEDCLYLNIYTTLDSYNKTVVHGARQLKPIMVWIHGGSLIAGSSNGYDGGILAGISDIIVITINYRLGAFGWLYVQGTEAKGYQGFKDQTMALKWIRENAVRFGGDPDKVTISGNSAGSWSVGYHLISKQSKGLFSGAILQSGIVFRIYLQSSLRSPEQATSMTRYLAENLGLNFTSNLNMLEFLQKFDAQTLAKKGIELMDIPVFPRDPDYFDKEPLEYMKSGDFNKVPVMAGFNNLESFGLTYEENLKNDIQALMAGNKERLKPILVNRLWLSQSNSKVDELINTYIQESNKNGTNVDYFRYLLDMLSDFYFPCPHYLFNELVGKYNGGKMFAYEFAQKPKYWDGYWVNYDGANHEDEIGYMFGSALRYKGYNDYSSQDKLLSEKMVRYWSDFIKYKIPAFDWKPHGLTQSNNSVNFYYIKYGQIKTEPRLKYSLNRKCQLWDEIALNP